MEFGRLQTISSTIGSGQSWHLRTFFHKKLHLVESEIRNFIKPWKFDNLDIFAEFRCFDEYYPYELIVP